MALKLLYEIGYRYFRVPWDIGPRQELVQLVTDGQLTPCRAIDLGSGSASNVIFLAQHGFEVIGVDFAKSAIEKGRVMAKNAGVKAQFIVDDLTNLQNVRGVFDLLIDYGTMDDLKPQHRELYLKNVLPLTRPGSMFLLYGHEWDPRWWERSIHSSMAFVPGEVQRRFGDYFEIQRIAGSEKPNFSKFPPGYSVYLMKRNSN
jgi:hypothetical protein